MKKFKMLSSAVKRKSTAVSVSALSLRSSGAHKQAGKIATAVVVIICIAASFFLDMR